MDSDETIRKLQAREEIKALRYGYAHHLDDGDWEEWGQLFAQDAWFKVYRPMPSAKTGPFEVEGRDAIIEFGESAIENSFEYSAHMMHNPLIQIDGGTATGRWYFDVFSAKPNGHANWHHGRYKDEYKQVGGTWKFAGVLVTVSAESEDVLEYELEYKEGEQGEFPSIRFPV